MNKGLIAGLMGLSTVWAVAQTPSPGRLEVAVTDASTGQLTPVRVRLTKGSRVVSQLPKEAAAVMYGLWDHADGYDYQPDSSFYVGGRFGLTLPPGQYELALSKGPEFLDQRHSLVVTAGKATRKTYRLHRWINMAARGWYSADDHIHIRRSPRDDSLLLNWTRAEGLHVGVLLRMGDFWETYYPQYAWGKKGVYQRGNYLLMAGQEDPRTPELGRALGLGADKGVRYREDYYYYDKVFDELHRRGGLTGYAHQAESFHGYRGLTLDGLRGKVDMLEILQYCVSDQPLRTQHFYHLLDLGYPVTAVAGSDFPWCGHDHDHGPPEHSARIGNARFYTYLGGPLTYETWKAALAAGHTFASSGPILEFNVNNALPGDRLNVQRGTALSITAQAHGHPAQVPLDTLEIIGHGRVLARVTKGEKGQSTAQLTLKLAIPSVERGIWLAARCVGGPQQAAHTTPVYVTVDGGGFHSPETAGHYLTLSEQYLRELETELTKEDQAGANPEQRVWYYRKGLKERIAETRRIIDELKTKLK